MNRPQILKFWKALDDSTNQSKTISSLKNKPGYDAEATLRRYAKAQTCFKNGDFTEVVSRKTYWNNKHIEKLRGWWCQANFKTQQKEDKSSDKPTKESLGQQPSYGPKTLTIVKKRKLTRAYQLGIVGLTERDLSEARQGKPGIINGRLNKDTPNAPKIREQAEMLKKQINLPDVHSFFRLGFCQVPYMPYPFSFGISQYDEHYPTVFIADQNHKISTVELGIDRQCGDEAGLFQKMLLSHLETSRFSKVLMDIDSWKKEFGQYCEECYDFSKIVQAEVKVQIKFPDDDVERNEKPGYKIEFFAAACANAVDIAKGNPPIDPGYFIWKSSNDYYLLGRNNGGAIYVANTELELNERQREHQALVIKFSDIQAKKLANLHSKLENMTQKICAQLLKFQYTHPLPGHCELC